MQKVLPEVLQDDGIDTRRKFGTLVIKEEQQK